MEIKYTTPQAFAHTVIFSWSVCPALIFPCLILYLTFKSYGSSNFKKSFAFSESLWTWYHQYFWHLLKYLLPFVICIHALYAPKEFLPSLKAKMVLYINFLSSTVANVVPYRQKAMGRRLLNRWTNLFSCGLALKGSVWVPVKKEKYIGRAFYV